VDSTTSGSCLDGELTPEQRDFRITFTIDEGRRYKFAKVTVDTQLKRQDAAY
jgi:outer membrane protein insertion porin family